ncbi:hypothetical protein COC65_24395 [Bacillus thuringiensis]|nr:hypothetical protein CN350_29610 [Bacillus cereus]PFL06876.1 hypothetical protein COJ24_27740 [Bacillus cereus]PGS31198.1 hypothetical protein COC65_24395 [Bacillus thuringiensis]
MHLKNRIAWNKNRNRILLFVGVISICSFAYFIYIAEDILKKNSYGVYTQPTVFILTVAHMFFVLYFFIQPLRRWSTPDIIELQELENELDLLSISHSSLEERSEKLFKHHHLELKKYYDENLKQSSWIFVVGIVCILIGFAIIGITLYFLIANSSNELENKIIVASVGAIGAILSNFIAVIYLKMHAETVKALTEFHNRFVNTHHFYFSNFLLSKIQNEDKREDALVELALKINGISPKAPAQVEENK